MTDTPQAAAEIPAETPQPADTPTPAEPTLAAERASATPGVTPEPSGPVDVYLGPPDAAGRQLLRFIDVEQRGVSAQMLTRIAGGRAVLAGQFVYYLTAGTNLPQRVGVQGTIEPLSFAYPPIGASTYDLLPSANGKWLAWASMGEDRSSYQIGHAAWDATRAQIAAKGTLELGTRIELVRVANDGETLFYALRPPDLADEAQFDAYYELFALDVQSGQTQRLPGEPGCGEGRACDAHISIDGTLLARTLPPQVSAAPVVVTNLVGGNVLARFEPDVAGTAGFELGYPFFTPDGELIYQVAAGIPEGASYRLVWANIVTGEQRLIAYLETTRHRPLAWDEDGEVLLTTREPDRYDTWRIDLRDGSVRQVSSMMFLGRILPPSGPS